ncbi:FeoB-associated Cys-rich membrane protein [Roseospira marina]|uniref:FeoB-associated Cys-rich membrane protein n=1 Tax=Roseospira marina TaxID=140057 RepID=A0A5M6I694_9PROT|nr:FeoB-associated Cys-rich membrane protein [Roseospira marina]KAA5603259.1 FeoB-associated Cys-rich membrane protein [Roseospira marina]MBB4316159.1 hypothetical protein [Roseospira marina]MBB5089365.1 hypothetical protein [Roseospira marina]
MTSDSLMIPTAAEASTTEGAGGTGTATATPIDLEHEAGFGLLDAAAVIVVVALAAAYLWRTMFGRRRKGCASCGSSSGCAVANTPTDCRCDPPR